MSSFLARVWAQKQIAYCPHTTPSGETWAKVKEGSCTSAGNAGGTTLVDTGGDSGTVDTYNGLYWVELLDGVNMEEMRRIVEDDGSGALTVETAFSNQVANGVAYRIWKSPDPVVVATVGGTLSTTQINMDARDEVDDYWKGYYMVPVHGACKGESPKLISAFQTTGGGNNGEFTFAAFIATPVGGDVFSLRKFIDVEIDPSTLGRDYTPRPGNRLGMSQGDGVLGARNGTATFNLPIRPSGTLAAADAEATAPEASGLMQAGGLEEVIQSSVTVGVGNASASAVDIETGDRENLAVGGIVIWNGNARRITSLDDGDVGVDTVHVSPAFPSIPTAGDVVYATRMYKKSTAPGDLLGCVIEVEVDGIRHTMTGCKGNVALTDAPTPELAFTLEVDHWHKDPTAAGYIAGAAYSTVAPVLSHDREFYLDTTATSISGFTATPGSVATPKTIQGAVGINGRAGFEITGYSCGATFDELLDASSATLPQELRLTARTAKAILAIFGSASMVCAVSLPVSRLVGQTTTKDMEGMVGTPNVVAAQDAGVAANGDDYDKMPDFAIHIS
ncbi:MAG TPA: hypothetical protein ENH33_00655 [Actinobacteria bacterium]|nr:hypothetical protein [Actinomycetota bacterium]